MRGGCLSTRSIGLALSSQWLNTWIVFKLSQQKLIYLILLDLLTMRRKVIMTACFLVIARKIGRLIAGCLSNERLIGEIQNLPVYSVSQLIQILKQQTANTKVHCFVRGLITSSNAFESALTTAKRAVYSVLLKTFVYSNRPRQIIDGLDLTSKIMESTPRLAKPLRLLDMDSSQWGMLVSGGTGEVDLFCALREIAWMSTRVPSSFLNSVRSFVGKITQPLILIGRLFRGAPIKQVLIQLGIRDRSHVLALGSCWLGSNDQLMIQTQLLTKDIQQYTNRIGKQSNKNMLSLLVYFGIFWLTTIIYSRDIQEIYQKIKEWWGGPANPQQLVEDREDSEDGVHGCYICYSKVRSVVFNPCKHYGICRTCYDSLDSKQCPTCKAQINSVIYVQKQK